MTEFVLTIKSSELKPVMMAIKIMMMAVAILALLKPAGLVMTKTHQVVLKLVEMD